VKLCDISDQLFVVVLCGLSCRHGRAPIVLADSVLRVEVHNLQIAVLGCSYMLLMLMRCGVVCLEALIVIIGHGTCPAKTPPQGAQGGLLELGGVVLLRARRDVHIEAIRIDATRSH
jgi:hypothetical protein